MATVALPLVPSAQGGFGLGRTVAEGWSRLRRHPVVMTVRRVHGRLELWLQSESSRDAWVSLGAFALAGFAAVAMFVPF